MSNHRLVRRVKPTSVYALLRLQEQSFGRLRRRREMGGSLSRAEAVKLFAGCDQRSGPPDRRKMWRHPSEPTDESLIGIYAARVGADPKLVADGLRAVWRASRSVPGGSREEAPSE